MPVVQEKYPQTLTLFLDAARSNMEGLNQEHLLHLAVERLFSSDDPIPELFRQDSHFLFLPRHSYSRLSEEEKEAVHLKIRGQDELLSAQADAVYQSILIYAGSIQRALQPEVDLILSTTKRELEKSN